jgi:hypothetical protein
MRLKPATISRLLAFLGLIVLPVFVWSCVAATPEIPAFPGTADQIRAYYESHATERGAACVNLRLHAITKSQVVSQTADRLVLAVTYFFVPFSDAYGENGICKEFRVRDFTFERSGQGWRLVSMGAARRY